MTEKYKDSFRHCEPARMKLELKVCGGGWSNLPGSNTKNEHQHLSPADLSLASERFNYCPSVARSG